MRWRASVLPTLVFLAGCASETPTVSIDGSSTVFPIVNVMAEDYGNAHPEVKVVANKSGTGSGMQKFARGEIDVAAASRRIEKREAEALRAAGIQFVEIPIAYDGVTVIVHPSNPISSLTMGQLRALWGASATVNDWGQVGGGSGRIAFYGPTDNHGTFEVFAAAVSGAKEELRRDLQTSQDFNVVVRSVAGDPRGIGYVGLDYYLENRDKVKAVGVDGVLPSQEAIAAGKYGALARPLFLYVAKRALRRPEIRGFLEYAFGSGGRSAVVEAKYVPLPDRMLAQVRARTLGGSP